MKLRLFVAATLVSSLAGAADRCEDFSVFFKVRGGSHCPDLWGHVAATVGDDSFDFGPQKKGMAVKFFGGPGGRYWTTNSESKDRRALTTREVRQKLSQHHCPIYEFRTRITAEQGKRFREFWAQYYKNDPQYWFFGKQCATSVSRALLHSQIIPKQTLSVLPFSLLEVVERDLVATCGENIGDHPRGRLLNPQAYK